VKLTRNYNTTQPAEQYWPCRGHASFERGYLLFAIDKRFVLTNGIFRSIPRTLNADAIPVLFLKKKNQHFSGHLEKSTSNSFRTKRPLGQTVPHFRASNTLLRTSENGSNWLYAKNKIWLKIMHERKHFSSLALVSSHLDTNFPFADCAKNQRYVTEAALSPKKINMKNFESFRICYSK
jgi:hypothetical protein